MRGLWRLVIGGSGGGSGVAFKTAEKNMSTFKAGPKVKIMINDDENS